MFANGRFRLIRSIYRQAVPAPVRQYLWDTRRHLRRSWSESRVSLRHRYLRARYRRGVLRVERPSSYPREAWTIDTNGPNAMRRSWVLGRARGSVLDVGCGRGYASCVIASSVKSVTGIDISQELLESASAVASACGVANISFVAGDAYSLPFGDKSFETVTLLEILEHLERPQDAVNEALRIARSRVIITVPAKGYMTRTVGHIQDFGIEDVVAMLPDVTYARSHPPFTFVLYEIAPG